MILGAMIGCTIATVLIGLMCEDEVVKHMDECDRLREELDKPTVNKVSIEIGYDSF